MKGSRKCSAMGAFVAAALSVACMLDPRMLRGLSFAAWQVLLFCLYYAEFGAMALMLAWIAWRLVLEREWRGYQLCTAAANNHVDELRRLLQAGVKPLSYKAYGQGGTALHYACAKGHCEAVRSLLQAGEHELLTTCLANGSTSLHVAAEHGHVGVVRELLKSAASTDKQALLTRCSHEGISCLIAAVQRGHLEVATYLAREGGWRLVQLRAEGGHSCLHFAARAGHAKMIEMLVEAGEACDARNNDGRTGALASLLAQSSLVLVHVVFVFCFAPELDKTRHKLISVCGHRSIFA